MVGFVPIVLGPMILIINQQGIPKTLVENTGNFSFERQVRSYLRTNYSIRPVENVGFNHSIFFFFVLSAGNYLYHY